MTDGNGTQLRNRSAKVLQLHPREVDRLAVERDGSTIRITIECHSEYDAMLVYDQAMDYLREGELVLGVSTVKLRKR